LERSQVASWSTISGAVKCSASETEGFQMNAIMAVAITARELGATSKRKTSPRTGIASPKR
jgi:hypothetical protein